MQYGYLDKKHREESSDSDEQEVFCQNEFAADKLQLSLKCQAIEK